jgi:hypothetical protein
VYSSQLEGQFYKQNQTVTIIKNNLDSGLRTALTDMNGSDLYRTVDHIKMIVKQLKGFKEFTNEMAGSITQAAVTALKEICDEAAGSNAQLCDRHDKLFGALYIQTNVQTGQKFQVVRSAGKHTNAILSCLNWMTENARRFVEKRTNVMNRDEKTCFFLALEELACSSDVDNLEMIRVSHLVTDNLTRGLPLLSDSARNMLADLILIGMNKNQQHVKAVAANYRRH